MIQVIYHKKFVKDYERLPKRIRELGVKKEEIFLLNPFDSRLESKKLHPPLAPLWSFRINDDYRIMFDWIGESKVRFVAARHRKDIYRNYRV